MADSICIFEGIYFNRLLPLAYLRPVYDLRCGILSLRGKIERYYSQVPITLHCRNYMADYMELKHPEHKVNVLQSDNVLFINGRVIVDEEFSRKISLEGPEKLYMCGETVVAARVSGEKLEELKKAMNDVLSQGDFSGLEIEEIDANIIHYPWDLVKNNEKELISDFYLLRNEIETKDNYERYDGVFLLNEKDIFIGDEAKIYPGAVLDAEEGPIFIGKGAKVLPGASIQGPAFIGDYTIVKMGARLYHNSNIGRVCKIGGEVENTIVHSFSNKQHDGFLGNSYLGSWVNLGAGTNNSDLKNNYGSIKVYINGEPVDSGSQFVGLTMGDHSKSAINSTFNTGTVIGVSCNIYGSGFPPRYVPSFGWGGSDAMTSYDLERSIEVAQRVMERRDVEMKAADEKMFRKVFDLTREERRKRGMPN
ncbi:MAG: hypothetical protein SCALA702_28490 [Melioribacteraceae bacterium]|nr:MAG: hypothetical protein SCALA702_28490 [Melioribacteraceae bacterium]